MSVSADKVDEVVAHLKLLQQHYPNALRVLHEAFVNKSA